MLEITITHNLRDQAEVRELFERRLIALDFNRHGPDPAAYESRTARQSVELFHEIAVEGAAVIAAYKSAMHRKADRLIGEVPPASEFIRLNGLLCLPLSLARVVDSSRNFLANLPPRQCTIQKCHSRAQGRLLGMVRGKSLPRDVGSLHHADVEVVVDRYAREFLDVVESWTASRVQQGIDHLFVLENGEEAFAQTTISRNLVEKKSEILIEQVGKEHQLWFFGPESERNRTAAAVQYFSIEDAFHSLDTLPSGRWLIDRMLGQDGT